MPKPPKPRTAWTTVSFGDVVRLAAERSSNPESDGFEPGDLRIRRWGAIADGTTFTSVFRPGHVLFGKRRAYQRKVAVADFSGVCSGDIYVLEPKGKDLMPELLPFICQTDAFFEQRSARLPDRCHRARTGQVLPAFSLPCRRSKSNGFFQKHSPLSPTRLPHYTC